MEKTAGKELKCRRCRKEAIIYLNEGRYKVYCVSCGEDTYLKTYNSPCKARNCDLSDLITKKVSNTVSDKIEAKQGVLL